MTLELLELVAVFACTLFAGAAIYINAVEHPARLSCGTEIAARQWAPSYKRGHGHAGFARRSRRIVRTRAWTPGRWSALVMGIRRDFCRHPFTLVVILPTNHRLLDPGLDSSSTEMRQLLERWGALHAVRSLLSVVASILFLWAAIS